MSVGAAGMGREQEDRSPMPSMQTRTAKAGVTRYVVRLRVDGKQTSTVHDTKPDAEQFARDVQQRGGQWAFDNWIREAELAAELTLDQWAERNFAALTNVGPATLAGYCRDWRVRWKPQLGHMELSQITREDVARALNAQTGADKAIANAWGTLASMLKIAVVDGHLVRSPAAGIKLPRRTAHENTEHRYLTAAEVRQVIEDTNDRYKPLVWMLAGTGMR